MNTNTTVPANTVAALEAEIEAQREALKVQQRALNHAAVLSQLAGKVSHRRGTWCVSSCKDIQELSLHVTELVALEGEVGRNIPSTGSPAFVASRQAVVNDIAALKVEIKERITKLTQINKTVELMVSSNNDLSSVFEALMDPEFASKNQVLFQLITQSCKGYLTEKAMKADAAKVAAAAAAAAAASAAASAAAAVPKPVVVEKVEEKVAEPVVIVSVQTSTSAPKYTAEEGAVASQIKVLENAIASRDVANIQRLKTEINNLIQTGFKLNGKFNSELMSKFFKL